ncbi:MAG: acyl-CoA dehydrogenase family protein [Chloroflexota bacterium]
MNFDLNFATNPALVAFQDEVHTWLEENAPRDVPRSADPILYTHEEFEWRRDIGRKLGAKGWLYPTFPSEYGGGGLDLDRATIIQLALDEFRIPVPPYYNSGGPLAAASILVWGTEEQKQFFVPPILRGETVTWQLLTEPQGGSDLATVTTKATRDGDDYVINGQKVFVGGAYEFDYAWTIVNTDPLGPRHQNVSWIMVPAKSEGMTRQSLDLFTVHGAGESPVGPKEAVFFDNVRVPAFNLVGGENNGWKVASTHLEYEHGGAGHLRNIWVLDEFFQYCKETKFRGKSISENPDVRDILADVWADYQVDKLLGLRTFWLHHTKRPMSYEGIQSTFYHRMFSLRTSQRIQQALGYFGLVSDPQWTPNEGRTEVFVRYGLGSLHGGGTHDTDRVIMSRRMGLGRNASESAGQMV